VLHGRHHLLDAGQRRRVHRAVRHQRADAQGARHGAGEDRQDDERAAATAREDPRIRTAGGLGRVEIDIDRGHTATLPRRRITPTPTGD
jgi:hypothetical protein